MRPNLRRSSFWGRGWRALPAPTAGGRLSPAACRVSMGRRHSGAAIAAVVIAVLALYAGTLSSLVRHWGSDDDFSHGFFVIPLAAYFVWERRTALRETPLKPSWL